jgi:hypothetical protein
MCWKSIIFSLKCQLSLEVRLSVFVLYIPENMLIRSGPNKIYSHRRQSRDL